ncbi:MAG: hypothetical protein IKL22_03485 [Lachnospiraceae bacterium]|nr:hypothetical protein [Lachnospiraceae bacterium]
MKKKILHLILTSILLFSLTACQKEASESTMPESEAKQQTEEATQTAEAETEEADPAEESSQAEESETEPISYVKEVQNEFFKVTYDSFSENEDFYIITFIFTNVSDIAYYKGDELYQPGESWEKKVKIEKDKWADFCKNPTYIHYKLYDASVYDENANVLFSGGASFENNEEFEVYNLEIFGEVPVSNE